MPDPFPVRGGAQRAGPAAPAAARVMVIDSDQGSREEMRRVLEGGGYPVRTSRDGETALRLLEQEPAGQFPGIGRQDRLPGLEPVGQDQQDLAALSQPAGLARGHIDILDQGIQAGPAHQGY